MKKRATINRRRPLERFREFIHEQQSVGIVILVATCFSLFFSNYIFKENYIHLWHTPIQISFLNFSFSPNIEWIINDALMPIFFLLVGLEIKREIIAGELSNIKTAMLPIIAALGGMLMPALIYVFFNANNPQTINGWAIPTATDIAFALAIMTLLGNKVPLSLKLLLTTLAVVDDLGAIIVIAVFYTAKISFTYFAIAGAIYIALLLMNKFKVKILELYLLLGIGLWLFILLSGIHATIAGVLLASTIPYENNKENNLIDTLEKVLHLPVNFLILPAFAICNTAIPIDPIYFSQIGNSLSLGIMLGLFVGKTVGIFSLIYIALKSKLLMLPTKVKTVQLLGTAMLGGIGFTMSIFITMLAFKDPSLILATKLYVILASVFSGIAGYLILFFSADKTT